MSADSFPRYNAAFDTSACHLLYLTRAEAAVSLDHHTWFFVLGTITLFCIYYFWCPSCSWQDEEFSCGTPYVNTVNDWSCSSYSWFSLITSAAPVLDQDTLLLRAVQTAQRQSLIKYCRLRIVSYKLAIQHIITSAAGFLFGDRVNLVNARTQSRRTSGCISSCTEGCQGTADSEGKCRFLPWPQLGWFHPFHVSVISYEKWG